MCFILFHPLHLGVPLFISSISLSIIKSGKPWIRCSALASQMWEYLFLEQVVQPLNLVPFQQNIDHWNIRWYWEQLSVK